jgi:hypothetical protein
LAEKTMKEATTKATLMESKKMSCITSTIPQPFPSI